MKEKLLLLCLFFFSVKGFSQNTFQVIVQDARTKEALPGVAVFESSSGKASATDVAGKATLTGISDGKHFFRFSFIGYRIDSLEIVFPLARKEDVYVFSIVPEEQELDEIIVSSTRTNARIEDLPQKVEVLGQEEMDEESMLVPNGIGSILGDLSVITIQRTNPINGNDAVRMQGLDPQYTQMLRDGLPLYDGFSGSLGVLSIPPLDLKQVEIIKGSMSTLYGGGAIAGLINFISKTPVDTPQTTALVNVSSLQELNAHTFISRKNEKTGFTLFTGIDARAANDVNKDGMSEVPESKGYTFHPRFFYYINNHEEFNAGLTSISSLRRSGDMDALSDGKDTLHPYLASDHFFRNTIDMQYKNTLSKTHSVSAKTAVGIFRRNYSLPDFYLKGTQYSSYTEFTDNRTIEKHTLTSGINITTESFVKNTSTPCHLGSYEAYTLGVFIQDGWQLSEKVMLEAGLRDDYVTNGRNFFMPRIAMFYKPNKRWSIRLASGSGYKLPNILNLSEPASRLYNNSKDVVAERSFGVNADLNFHTLLWDKLSLELNQAFYYTNIYYPLYLFNDPSGIKIMDNGHYYANSYGTDTYARFKYDDMEFYLGYNHTEATYIPMIPYGTPVLINTAIPFNPKDKLSATFLYEMEGEWRMGPEISLSANQYTYNNTRVPNFLFMAAMVERKFNFGSIVLNCENILDERQSRHEALNTGTLQKPVFTSVWGPVEGRVVNVAIKIKM